MHTIIVVSIVIAQNMLTLKKHSCSLIPLPTSALRGDDRRDQHSAAIAATTTIILIVSVHYHCLCMAEAYALIVFPPRMSTHRVAVTMMHVARQVSTLPSEAIGSHVCAVACVRRWGHAHPLGWITVMITLPMVMSMTSATLTVNT